jgi:hypothetical protein
MDEPEPSASVQAQRRFRKGVASRLAALETGMNALLRATLNNGVVLPAEIEREVRDALKMQDRAR